MRQKTTQQEDAFLLAHVMDMVKRDAFRGFTAFLDMRQYTMLTAHLQAGTYRFYGGYPGAQRGILCIHPQDIPPVDEEYPIRCLTFTFREADTLTHRDVLGSMMAQQIQRDTVGDILVTAGKIQCFVSPSAAVVCQQIRKIGNVGVQVTDALPFSGDYIQKTRVLSGTVETPRLDAVLRTALNQGRGRCAELIRSGLISLNYQQVQEVSCIVKEGDVFSVRGYGKFRIRALSDPTRKGRLHISIEKFL